MSKILHYRIVGFLKRWLSFWSRCLAFKHVWLIGLASLIELSFSDFGNWYLSRLLDEQISSLSLMLIIGAILVFNMALALGTMAVTLFVLRNVQRSEIYEPFGGFLKSNFNHLAIEGVRSIGQVFIYGLLFIVPGLIKFIRFAFVPFIVVFDRRYLRDEIDALRESVILSRVRWWSIAFITLLFYLIPGLLFYSWELDPTEAVSYFFQLLAKVGVLFLTWTLYTTCLFELFKSVLSEEHFTLAGPYVIATSVQSCGDSAES